MAEKAPQPESQEDLTFGALNVLPPQLHDLHDIYEANDVRTSVDQRTVETRTPSVKVLHLSELLVGHKDADIPFYERVVAEVAALPPEAQPDAIVLSGLVQGDFKFLEKRRRTTLVPELSSMDAQFRAGREMLDLAISTDIPVIYNMSNDDRRIAEEYTVEVFRKMHELTKKQEGLPYWKIDQMRQHPSWNTHLQFQTEVVFPYCLRSGRRLQTSEELAEATNGVVHSDEYFVLFDTYRKLQNGEPVNPDHVAVLEMNNLAQPGQLEAGLAITNDVDLTLKTKGSQYTNMIRHNLNFSSQPMYQAHLNVPIEAVGQIKASGGKAPNMLTTQHQQEAVGVNVDGTWVISLAGLIRASQFLRSNASSTDAPGDISRRIVSTRRRIGSPGATMHELTDDGRHVVSIYNEKLMDKADSLEDRTTVAFFNDWQTGSPTARPDLQVKLMDYVNQVILPNNPVHIFWGGDILHGRNYPDFPNEGERVGLISMNAQERFVEDLIAKALTSLDPVNIENLREIGVIPGNHEWNSGTTKWHGYTFTSYLRRMFENYYREHGVEPRVKQHEAIVTPEGEQLKTWTALNKVGDYGVLAQHLPLERGAKGNNSGPPVYQASGYFRGAGQLMEGVDIAEFGHWHHPQYGVFGDKLAIISGSLAGLSGYEFMRGYRAIMGATLIHLCGGLPIQVDFLGKDTLAKHKIREGYFSDKNLRSEGYRNDKNFDPLRHGIFVPDFPKSALQKAILRIRDEASGQIGSRSIF